MTEYEKNAMLATLLSNDEIEIIKEHRKNKKTKRE